MTRIPLTRDQGPECPTCGCPTSLKDAGVFGGRPYSVFGCDFCGGEVTIGRPPAVGKTPIGGVPYNVVRCRCPECGAINPPVVSTPSETVRRHKCSRCGTSFKSEEVKK
jgi:hypothetical protein